MVKKTNVLLVALMATMSIEAARSATYAEKVYVDSRDTTLINRMKTQDSRLAMIRDWVNPQDEAGNRAVLDTEAQDAYRAINELKSTLEAAIEEKQEKGDYLVADDLKDLQNAVSALDLGKADVSTVTALQETIGKLGETYATKAGMTDADNALKASIDALDTALKAINLSEYAKSADVNVALTAKEDATNKLATATAEQIETMTTEQKQAQFPSVAVAQTIANAAVSKVNEFAGDLTELETQVSTNTADIKQINEAGYQTKSDVDTAIAELVYSDTAVDKEFVTAVSENDGVITVSRRALAAADIPVIAVSQVAGLQEALDAKLVSLTGQEGVIDVADGVVSIAAKGIGTGQLADKAVTSDKIADNAVTAGKIATDAVTAGTIADAAVEAGNLAANAVVEGNIAAGAVTAGTIAAGAVKNNNISDGELSVAKVGGLQDSLNAKFEVPAYTTTTQNGTYVLTATELDGKVTYAWENIAGRDE